MSKLLKLNLNATEIKQAVKSDSYITGLIDKSADMVKNASLAFNEQAGDEQYHETKLFRTMRGAMAKLESQIAEYVETSNPNATVTDNLTSRDTSTFYIQITTNLRRHNQTPAATHARKHSMSQRLRRRGGVMVSFSVASSSPIVPSSLSIRTCST